MPFSFLLNGFGEVCQPNKDLTRSWFKTLKNGHATVSYEKNYT